MQPVFFRWPRVTGLTTSSARPTGTCAIPRSRYRKDMSTATASSIFEQLGIAPVINARGNNTVLGGSTPSARVHRAMQDAERYYVDMQQLLERSGKAIAELLGAEAAYVTPGAAAALALGTAACMAGTDADKIARLPDTTGLPRQVLIQA